MVNTSRVVLLGQDQHTPRLIIQKTQALKKLHLCYYTRDS